jgi:hypothetical protein
MECIAPGMPSIKIATAEKLKKLGVAWCTGKPAHPWPLGKPNVASSNLVESRVLGGLVGITLIGRVPHCSANAVRA